jgi:hypothetical protein
MNHKKLPLISRGATPGAPPRWPQARSRHEGTDGDPAGTQSALESGFPVGHARRWPALSYLGGGRRLRRECLALVADTSLPGLRVVRELDALIAVRGRPAKDRQHLPRIG